MRRPSLRTASGNSPRAEKGYLRSYIVSPPTVWGTQTGPLVAAGVAHAHSVQMPLLIAAAIYFVIVLPMNKMIERRNARLGINPDEEEVDPQVALLTEIRDALVPGAAQAETTSPKDTPSV